MPTYEESVTRYTEIQQTEQGIVNEASRSHLLIHGHKTPRAYVMVHGTTNSPLQWLELGETLHARGHNVLIQRMPYHGLLSRLVSELTPLTAQDLRAYATQAVELAAGLGDELVVVGISGGGAVASWMAQNRPEVKRSLLLAPFYGIASLPDLLTPLLVRLFSRLPNFDLHNPQEPYREWAYRGEATRGVAAFLALGQEVIVGVKNGARPHGPVSVLTTASDQVVSHSATAGLIDLWRQSGADVATYEFEAVLDIPHNAVDPSADPAKKRLVYAKMLEMLEEQL